MFLADLPGQDYCFPVHIAATDERPDIVIQMDHQCTIVELIDPFKDNFTDAECRKRDHYTDFLCMCTRIELITIQVGSRGALDLPSLSRLKQMCKPTVRVWTPFVVSLATSAISVFLRFGAVGTLNKYCSLH